MARAALCGKKILVTAGPTWVALDDVRVISNVSTGALGMLLAQKAAASGAKVDLLLGPVVENLKAPGIKIFRFKFFDGLKRLMVSRLKAGSYDVILHAAAVSDYVMRARPGKLTSDKKHLVVRLTRAPKLMDIARRMNPEAFLVMFKLESRVSDGTLIKRSRAAMKKAKADMVVANRFEGGSYRGFVLDAKTATGCCATREKLAQRLLGMIQEKMNS